MRLISVCDGDLAVLTTSSEGGVATDWARASSLAFEREEYETHFSSRCTCYFSSRHCSEVFWHCEERRSPLAKVISLALSSMSAPLDSMHALFYLTPRLRSVLLSHRVAATLHTGNTPTACIRSNETYCYSKQTLHHALVSHDYVESLVPCRSGHGFRRSLSPCEGIRSCSRAINVCEMVYVRVHVHCKAAVKSSLGPWRLELASSPNQLQLHVVHKEPMVAVYSLT